MTTTLLFEWAVKGALLLGATFLALHALRGAPAGVRRAALAAAVLGTLALPLAPRWLPVAFNAPPPVVAASLAEAAPLAAEGLPPTPAASPGALTRPEPTNPSPAAPAWLAGLWAAGALLLLARLGVDHLRAADLKRRAMHGPEGVLFSHEIDTPMVLGVWRPVILMPAETREAPAASTAASLAHERAHLAGHDTRLLFLADVLCALRWFDPLAWWAARRLRTECELTADAAVLAGGVRPSEYAALLLSLASPRPAPPVALGALGAGGAGVRERIERVLEGTGRTASRRLAWSVGVGGGLFAGVLGCAGPAHETPSAPEETVTPAPIAAPSAALRQPMVGLDEVVQAKVTEELFKLQADESPVAASVVVVEVETGRVVALAGLGPQGDATAQEAIEPASVLKALTAAAALDAGVTPDTRFSTGDTLVVEGHVLTDALPAADLDLDGILSRSSNIGAARLAEKLGVAALQRQLARFGVTPTDAPAWTPLQAALAASGVGLLARPVDIARAYATLGNGGFDPMTREAVVSSAAAETVCRLLAGAVEHGTGREAHLDEVRVGGKTGTLTVRDAADGVEAALTRASFAGLVPIDAPRWAIHVRVDTRAAGATGGRVAAPLFRRIARALDRDC
jgi:beta-lactamase regulating signal transducer with metallopeptidase domain